MATALLVVDVQEGMFMPGYEPYDGHAVVERIAGLMRAARAAGTPVFFVQHDGGEGDPLQAGSPGFPIVAALAPAPGEDVTVKTERDVFESTNIEEKLRAAGIDRLVVCGMQTDFCVGAAVRSAGERGFATTVVADGHTTYADGKTEADIIAEHNGEFGTFASVVPASEITFG
jgi:nicotinamidase-related amidase